MSPSDDDATQVYGAGSHAPGALWHVNLSPTDTRTMTASEIGLAYGRGILDAEEAFVWREGMTDWVVLGRCVELLPMLAAHAGMRGVASAAPPQLAPTMVPPFVATEPSSSATPFAPAVSPAPPPVALPVPTLPPGFAQPVALTVEAPRARETSAPAPAGVAMASVAAPIASPLLVKRPPAIAIAAGAAACVAVGGWLALRTSGGDAAAPASASALRVEAVAAPSSAPSVAAPPGEIAPAVAASPLPSAAASQAWKPAVGSLPPVGVPPASPPPASTASPSPVKIPQGAPDAPAFNIDAARTALAAAAGRAASCSRPGGPTGRGKASVTFAPTGRVAVAQIDPPFAGTPVGNCVSASFRSARVPAFTGSSQTLPRSFTIP